MSTFTDAGNVRAMAVHNGTQPLRDDTELRHDADAMASYLENVLDYDYARHDPIWDDIRKLIRDYRSRTKPCRS